MMTIPLSLLLVCVQTVLCGAFLSNNVLNQVRDDAAFYASRRDILLEFLPMTLASTVLIFPKEPSLAASGDSDLTSQMFNIDGSLKDGYESEVKFRDVSFMWDQSDAFAINEDGMNVQNTQSGSQYSLSYQYPMRWSDGKDGDPIFFDRSEGINRKATKGITIYQAPGTATDELTKKAATIGVAKAFNVPKELSRLYKADLISGRTVDKGDQKYYEFDMAVAPDTCGDSNENLGLGFCPYGE